MQHHGFPGGVFKQCIFPDPIQGKRRTSRQDPQELRRQLHHAEEADKGLGVTQHPLQVSEINFHQAVAVQDTICEGMVAKHLIFSSLRYEYFHFDYYSSSRLKPPPSDGMELKKL